MFLAVKVNFGKLGGKTARLEASWSHDIFLLKFVQNIRVDWGRILILLGDNTNINPSQHK